jgi:hypothetical protein
MPRAPVIYGTKELLYLKAAMMLNAGMKWGTIFFI